MEGGSEEVTGFRSAVVGFQRAAHLGARHGEAACLLHDVHEAPGRLLAKARAPRVIRVAHAEHERTVGRGCAEQAPLGLERDLPAVAPNAYNDGGARPRRRGPPPGVLGRTRAGAGRLDDMRSPEARPVAGCFRTVGHWPLVASHVPAPASGAGTWPFIYRNVLR